MSPKMKIAHLIATNFYGGPERQIVNHARYLGRRGGTPHIVTFEENGQSSDLLWRAEESGIATHMLRSQGAFNPCVIMELAKFLRKEEIGILCTHGYKSDVVGRLASWLVGIPDIAVSRGWTGESFKISLYEWLDRLFLRVADHVVAVSAGQRRKVLNSGIAEDKVSVIRNSIELANRTVSNTGSFRREMGIPQDAVLIASAGRLSPEKNYEGLIEAAKVVSGHMPEVYFVVCGDGFLRLRLELAVKMNGMEKRFNFTGFRSDLDDILAEVDIFVLPSWTEGLPNVVLEAFACKKPVVATAVGGTPEVVDHGVNGLLTEPGDNVGLAEALMQLASNPELRRSMGENGYRVVADRFYFESQTDKYVELFESFLCRDLGDGSEAVD